MLKWSFLIVPWLLSLMTQAQSAGQKNIDSLQLQLKQTSTDTQRISLMTHIATASARIGDTSAAYNYAYSALAIANRQADSYYKGMAYYSLGSTHLLSFLVDSAIVYYDRAVAVLKNDPQPHAQRLHSRAVINLSQAYFEKGYTERGATLLVNVLPELEKNTDTVAYATSLHNLAAAFITLKQYPKAYFYTLRDINLSKKTNAGAESIAGTYLNAALLMYYMDSTNTMNSYLQQARQQLNLSGKNRLWTRYFCYQAFYLSALHQFAAASEALAQATKNISLYPDRETEYDIAESKRVVYAAQGKLREAREAAYRLEKMARDDAMSEYLLPALKDIATYSKKIGDLTTAHRYLEEYTILKDSADKKQTAFKLTELEERYQSSQKERQIMQLQNNAKIQQVLLWSAIVLAVLISSFFLYRFKQKKIQTAQKLQSFNQQKEIAITQALLTGEERERSRLARDLHDGLGGILAAIKLNLSQMMETKIMLSKNDLAQTIDRLGSAVNELRHISRDMMPESLLRSGLQGALTDLCENYIAAGLRITFNAFDISENILPEQQLIIYRMIQEILNNAVRHSGASRVLLQCTQSENIFFITVEDNGNGFDANNKEYEGLGLKNIRNRVDFLKGNMHIDSSEEGTIINIELHVTK